MCAGLVFPGGLLQTGLEVIVLALRGAVSPAPCWSPCWKRSLHAEAHGLHAPTALRFWGPAGMTYDAHLVCVLTHPGWAPGWQQ